MEGKIHNRGIFICGFSISIKSITFLLRLLKWILTQVNSTLVCHENLLALSSGSNRTASEACMKDSARDLQGSQFLVPLVGFFSGAFLRNGHKLTSNGLERICFVGRKGLINFWAAQINPDLSKGLKID